MLLTKRTRLLVVLLAIGVVSGIRWLRARHRRLSGSTSHLGGLCCRETDSNRIEMIPINPVEETRGFLKGIDTSIERELDRL